MTPLVDPIFILSSERSGTNLLRVLLDNHSKLFGPRAPQLFRAFAKSFPYYTMDGVLKLEELADDVLEIVNHPFVEWGIQREALLECLEGARSFLDAWEAVYRLKSAERRERIVCKENHLFYYAFELKDRFPQARFIFLYRDVRDVCASWMKVPNGFNNVSAAAQNWNQEQLEIIKATRTFGLEVYHLAYEDLISDTPKAMTGLLEYLELEVEADCFRTDKGKGEEVAWNEYWKNLGKGVLKGNSQKYKKSLSDDEVLLIETRAAESMCHLGYSRETVGKWQAPPQSIWHERFKSLAFRFERPKYRKKEVVAEDTRQGDFARTVNRIEKKRWKVFN